MKFGVYCYVCTTVAFGILYGLVPSAYTIPLVVLCLGFFAYCENNRYATFIAVGMLFSAFGDVSLRLEDGNFLIFLCGVVNYLIAHLCYIRAYLLSEIDFTCRFYVGPLFIAYCAAMLGILCPGVDAPLIPAIIIYAAIICTMAFLATNRYLTSDISLPSRTAALVGSLVFLSSDSILSLNRFYTHIPQADSIIWITYCIGQMFIAISAKEPLRNNKSNEGVRSDDSQNTSPLLSSSRHSVTF